MAVLTDDGGMGAATTPRANHVQPVCSIADDHGHDNANRGSRGRSESSNLRLCDSGKHYFDRDNVKVGVRNRDRVCDGNNSFDASMQYARVEHGIAV